MGGQPSGPQAFHDPSNQQQPSQSHPGFQNLANPSLQTLNNRSAMFQQPNNPAAHRQLELMGLALNQQPQNGPINFAARMQQQQQALQQQALNSQGQQPQQPENFIAQPPPLTRANFLTLQERAANLKNIITQQESQLLQLTSQRARIGDAQFMDKVRNVSADLKIRQEQYGRLVHFLRQMQSQNAMNGMGGMLPQQANGGPQAGQPAWMPPGPPQNQPPFNPNGQQSGGQPGPSHQQGNGHMNGHMQQPAVPTRSGPTPQHQQFPGPGGGGGPFQQQPPAGQEGRPFPPIPPLEKARFENVYKNFCSTRNVVHNARMMSLEARPIDLYDLHTQVMLEGGGLNVGQKDLWAVIGGRMGFVQFPASDTEPAKSGPGVAQHLAHVYKEYLAAFDTVYVTTVMDQRRKNDALTAQRGLAMGGPPPMRAGISDPVQMQQVLNYLPVPPAELRRRGVPEQLIQFIENNRAALMKTVMDQSNFRIGLRPGDQGGGGMHPGGGGQPPFSTAGGMNNGLMQPGPPFRPHPHGGMPGNSMENAPPQQQQQQNVMTRPSREHLTAAMQHIAKLKADYSPERMMQNVPAIEVPVEQRMEYNNVLEQLHRACTDLDHKLPMLFAVLKKEDVVRRLVIIVQTAIQQRAMISSGSTRFLVNLDTLRTMLQQVQDMNERFAAVLQGLMNKPPNMTMPMGMQQPRPPVQNQAVPPPLNPPPIPQPANGLPQPPQRPINLREPPIRAPKRTPNAPTPPPYLMRRLRATWRPRSRCQSQPKGKAAAKPKPPTRRKQSINNKAVAATAAAPAPPPAEPVTAPSPQAGLNKRPREEASPPQQPGQSLNSAPSPSVANEPSPPKRQKQWEGPPSDALKARAEMVENVKTEEDGAAFLEQMTELFKMAAGNDGQQDSMTSDFSETLDTLFKGFGAVPDDGASGMSSLGMGGEGSGVPQDGAPPVVDEFTTLGSKAETPDLISSSSTNPSPESGSEGDPHQALTSDVKSEDFTDHLRLGVWKEVDGGESAYFHSGQWKWDSPMQSLDQPWAIFNS
ncbi:hypothetical protein B0H11DRAFT_2002483 [Mycena galericulata]|nr:hypothetical protein B0H11DRAFT_2002483 [Mycena galericulata]